MSSWSGGFWVVELYPAMIGFPDCAVCLQDVSMVLGNHTATQ